MADWKLSPADLQILVDIMTRSELFDTPERRKNFFTFSGYADLLPKLQSEMHLTDRTDEFCKTLVRYLKEGILPDGSHHTFYPLLDYLLSGIRGQTIENSLIKKWMEESEVWVRQQQHSPLPTPTLNLEAIYEQALSAFFDEQWEEVLRLVTLLENHIYNDSHRMTKVADMKEDATEEWIKAKRQQEYDADYRHVVMFTRKPERLPRAKQAWATFLKKHREDFSPARDPEKLSLFFEQHRLLEVMYNLDVPPQERTKAGCDLAKIGDPRPEVMEVDAMHFCWVPAGRFWMGSASKEEDPFSGDNERPAGWFDLPFGYWMGRFPVTNAQYAQFVTATEAKNAPINYGEPFSLSNHPVVGVSWHQALAFTQWLTGRWQKAGYLPKGWKVTLPNEPEWEKAARGGETIVQAPFSDPSRLRIAPPLTPRPNPLLRRRYPYGNDPNTNHSNYDKSQINTTSAVGLFPGGLSPYGCEVMSGNAWEWTRSLWDEKYPFTHDRDDLTLHNEHRALRSGAFFSDEGGVRCAYRGRNNPNVRGKGGGFRVVVVAVSPSPL